MGSSRHRVTGFSCRTCSCSPCSSTPSAGRSVDSFIPPPIHSLLYGPVLCWPGAGTPSPSPPFLSPQERMNVLVWVLRKQGQWELGRFIGSTGLSQLQRLSGPAACGWHTGGPAEPSVLLSPSLGPRSVGARGSSPPEPCSGSRPSGHWPRLARSRENGLLPPVS